MRLRSGRLYESVQPRAPRPYVDYAAPHERFPINVGIDKTPIAMYDGTGSILDFLDQFELLSNAKEWDPDAKCRWLPVYLSSAPAMFYKGLARAVKEDWVQLKPALVAEFNNAEAKNLFLIKLGKVRQNLGESAQQFAARIQRMSASAYEGVGAAQLGPLLLTHFQQGLRPNIKKHVLMAAPQTFEEAVKKAKTIELNQGIFDAEGELAYAMTNVQLGNQQHFQQKQQHWPQKNQNRTFKPFVQNVRPDRGATFNSYSRRPYRPPMGGTSMSTNVRYNAPRVPNYRMASRGQSFSTNSGIPGANVALKRHIQCYKCGRFGHFRDECRSRVMPDPRMPARGVNFVVPGSNALWSEYNAFVNRQPGHVAPQVGHTESNTINTLTEQLSNTTCMLKGKVLTSVTSEAIEGVINENYVSVPASRSQCTTVGLDGQYVVQFHPKRLDTTLEINASSSGISFKETCKPRVYEIEPTGGLFSVSEKVSSDIITGECDSSEEHVTVGGQRRQVKCFGVRSRVGVVSVLRSVVVFIATLCGGIVNICPGRRRAKGRYGFALAILVVILSLVVGQCAAGFEAYDCSRAKLSEDYALSKTKECENTAPPYVDAKEAKYYLYEKLDVLTVAVKECEVTGKRYMYYCGMWSHNSYVDMDMYERPIKVSESDCRGYFLDRAIRKYGTTADLSINATTLFKVVKVGTLEQDGACRGGSFTEGKQKYNNVVVVVEYSITLMEYNAAFEEENGRMITKGLSQCTLRVPTCFTGRSRLNYNLPRTVCTLVYLGKLDITQIQGKQPRGTASSRNHSSVIGSWTLQPKWERLATILYSAKRGILLLRKAKTFKCSAQMFETNYDKLYLAKRPIRVVKHETPLIQARLDLYFNNKIDYLQFTYQRDVRAIYYSIIQQLCTVNQQLFLTKMALAYKNPQMAGVLLLNEPGVFGIRAGEVMYFYRCEVVYVKLAKTGKCAAELSVIYRNVTYYMQPFTRILKRTSTEAVCSSVVSPKFHVVKGLWIDGVTQSTTLPPKRFNPRIRKVELELQDIERLHTMGIYTKEQLENTQRAVRSSWMMDDAVHKIVAQGTKSFADDSWQLRNMMGIQTPYSIMHNYLGKTWTVLTQLGQIMSGLIGAYFVFSVIRVVLSHFISVYNVYQMVGLTRRFFLALCPLLKAKTSETAPPECHRQAKHSHDTVELWTPQRRGQVSSDLPPPMPEMLINYCPETRQTTTGITMTEPMYTTVLQHPVVHAVDVHYSPIITGAKFNGHPMEMLIDTGSSVSIVAAACTVGMNFVEVRQATQGSPRSFTGHAVDIIDEVVGYVLLGDILVKHIFLRAKNIIEGAILGMDFLMQLDHCTFDLKSRLVWLKKDSSLFSFRISTAGVTAEPVIYYIRSPVDIYIPSFQQRWVKLVDYVLPKGVTACVEALNVDNPPCEVPPQLVIGTGDIACFNPTAQDKVIKRGTLLAIAYPISMAAPVCALDVKHRNDNDVVNSQYKDSIYAHVLKKYSNIISKDEYDFGQTDVVQHTIPLEDTTPVKQRSYRCPERLKPELQTQVESMLQHNIIEYSSSPWASPVLLVKKKNGKYRMCVDYRRLNAQTRKDSYPLPRICDLIEKFKGSKVFSTLDLMKGYYQVEVHSDDREKTAFVTEEGLYQFNVMPFGLTGAPNTFQRLMDYLLKGLKCAMVYLDDIVVFSPNEEQHVCDLDVVLSVLHEAGLKVNLEKCDIGKQRIQFLGHIISAAGISPDPSLTEKVRECPMPKTVKEVQSFVGLASYYRRFVHQFAKIVQPLTKLIRKDQKFVWSQDQEEAFATLKDKLVTAPILAYPDLTKPFILQTDASNEAVGAVLAQKDEHGREHPIAYISRSLTNPERNYSTTEKECLALLHACQTFRHYLYGSEVVVVTDHAPLQWLQNNKDTSSRLIRWSLKLQDLNMKIQYKPGKSHSNADAMSRWIAFVSMADEVADAQNKDPELIGLIENVQYPYKLKKGRLHFQSRGSDLLVVPKDYRSLILFETHDGLLGAHLGIKRTEGKIMQKYYWPGIRENIRQYCKACEVCQTVKNPQKPGRQPLRPIAVNGVFERIAMDVLGPLPLTHNSNKYILVIQEYLTKWPLAISLPSQDANIVAQALVEEVFLVYGTPKILLTDRGTNFTSELIKSVNGLWGVKQSFTTPYHPQTDGMVERFNRTLITMIKSYVHDNQQNWDALIPYALYAYRTTIHTATRETPFFLMFGRDPITPLDQILLTPAKKYMEVPNYKEQMIRTFQEVWTKAARNIETAQKNSEKYYKTRPLQYTVGDLVNVYSPVVKKGRTKKLTKQWLGPYRIIAVRDTTLTVQKLSNVKKIEQVHMNRCKQVRVPTMMPLKEAKTQLRGSDPAITPLTNLSDEKPNITAKKESPAGTPKQCPYNLRPRRPSNTVGLVYLLVLMFFLVPPVCGEYQCREFSPYAPATVSFGAVATRVYFRSTAMKGPTRVCRRLAEVQQIDIIDNFGYQAAGRLYYKYTNGKHGVTDVWWIPKMYPPKITIKGRYAWCEVPYTPCVRGKMSILDHSQVYEMGLGAKPWYEYPSIPSLALPAEYTVNCCATYYWNAWKQGYFTNCTNCTRETWQTAAPNVTQFAPDTVKYPMKLSATWRQINCSYQIGKKVFNASKTNLFNSTISLHGEAVVIDPRKGITNIIAIYIIALILYIHETK